MSIRLLYGMKRDKPYKVSAVSYANTFPFIYGIEQKMNHSDLEMSLDVPAVCAEKLSKGVVDIGLVPVAELSNIPNAQIISKYCIGAIGEVKTVLLMSKLPLDEISEVYLDSESKTSVNLIKVLASRFWKKNWKWQNAPSSFPIPEKHDSIVLIGDKTYQFRDDYPYIYDLAEVWLEYTGKPFVFAAWVVNRKLPIEFIQDFNQALSFGLHNIDAALDVYAHESQKDELSDYLNNYISYDLDEAKLEGMELFLNYLKTI